MTGDYSLTDNSGGSFNLTLTTTASDASFTLTESVCWSSGVGQSGNHLSGSFSLSQGDSSDTLTQEWGSNVSAGYSLSQWETSWSSTQQSGNEVTGDFTLSGQGNTSLALWQTGFDAAGDSQPHRVRLEAVLPDREREHGHGGLLGPGTGERDLYDVAGLAGRRREHAIPVVGGQQRLHADGGGQQHRWLLFPDADGQ